MKNPPSNGVNMQAQLHPVSKSQTARIQSPVLARTEEPAEYRVSTLAKSQIIEQALALLEIDLREGTAFHTPGAVKDYITLHNGRLLDQYREVFSVLFLDSQNRMLAIEEMFSGTLTQTSIYPREVVRAALRHNAAAVVLTHNHPSGSVQPSRAYEALTQTLKSALALIDVRVLDHIITAGNKNLSMAEQGLI